MNLSEVTCPDLQVETGEEERENFDNRWDGPLQHVSDSVRPYYFYCVSDDVSNHSNNKTCPRFYIFGLRNVL